MSRNAEATPQGATGVLAEAGLVRPARYLQPGEPSADARELHRRGGRRAEVSEMSGLHGGTDNSLTRVVMKPSHMIGGYAQLSAGFNYGPTGTQRDEIAVIRRRSTRVGSRRSPRRRALRSGR